ncbi:hypothetical protein [Rhizobium laguerreae]|uniref:Uncharacterized protein n=1 Tax=Rhizobium laguerreae TaxID=1076926 RepID=A0ABR6G1Q8_9HYPH|nr:hypothetical protein [Rhizobium laguerreae]MBB3160212.1 hypothetical protein [Rhizobium laguerreae]
MSLSWSGVRSANAFRLATLRCHFLRAATMIATLFGLNRNTCLSGALMPA